MLVKRSTNGNYDAPSSNLSPVLAKLYNKIAFVF